MTDRLGDEAGILPATSDGFDRLRPLYADAVEAKRRAFDPDR